MRWETVWARWRWQGRGGDSKGEVEMAQGGRWCGPGGDSSRGLSQDDSWGRGEGKLNCRKGSTRQTHCPCQAWEQVAETHGYGVGTGRQIQHHTCTHGTHGYTHTHAPPYKTMISMIEDFLPSLKPSKNGIITLKDLPTTLKSSLTTRISRYSKKPKSCLNDRLDGLYTSLTSTSPSLMYLDDLWVNLMPSPDNLTMMKVMMTMKIILFFQLPSSIELSKLMSLPPLCSTVSATVKLLTEISPRSSTPY